MMKRVNRILMVVAISMATVNANAWPWVSPYAYCMGNPVKFIDPDGENPIYDMQGNFLGTDNTGLQGFYYVMNKEKFFQGMSNIEAGKYAVLGAIPSDVESRINDHYNKLPNRPDYDGFVTVG